MIPYIPCEIARERLESFVDGELPTADQVAVQAHLRACPTCATHVEDLSLIGWSVRAGAPASHPATDAKALADMQSGVLTRIRTERQQSLRARVPEMFEDMRLLWPALGATAAVLVCLAITSNIWRMTMAERRPDSLAATLHTLANPGTDINPLPLDPRMSIPRVVGDGFALDRISDAEAEYAVAAVVTQAGMVGSAQMLNRSSRPGEVEAVLDAFRESRFAPAQAPSGRNVAVMAVFYFTQTTVKESPARFDFPAPAAPRVTPAADTAAQPALPPRGTRSSLRQISTTA